MNTDSFISRSFYEKHLKRFLAEFLATTFYMFFGCLGCINYSSNSSLKASLHFGCVATFSFHCFYFLSGGFANPCVAVAALILGYLNKVRTAYYIVAHFLGAIFGYYLLILTVPSSYLIYESHGLCMAVPHPNLTWEQAFTIEFLLTCMLLLGYCSAWDLRNNHRETVPLRLGLLVTSLCLCGGQFTGASMNPARTISVALYYQNFQFVPMYLMSHGLATLVLPYLWYLCFTPKLHVQIDSNFSNLRARPLT